MYRLTASFKSCCSVVGALESVTPSLGAGVVFVVRYQKPLSFVTARKEGVCGVVGEGEGPVSTCVFPFSGVLHVFRAPFCLVAGVGEEEGGLFFGVRFTDV